MSVDIDFYMKIAMYIINAAIGGYMWHVRKNMATNKKITDIEDTINSHIADNGVQLAHIDERLSHAIGQNELAPLYEQLNSMNARLSKMDGKMHTLDLIHEMLLKEGRNKQ